MQYTDIQLKQALAKMLPETLKWLSVGSRLLWKARGHPDVLNTELLHLCWLVEETLTPEQQVDYYNFRLRASTNNGCVEEYRMIHATWQQRVIALAKVLNVEFV